MRGIAAGPTRAFQVGDRQEPGALAYAQDRKEG